MKKNPEKFSEQLNDILARVPNIPLADVPIGKYENANKCIRTVGEPPKFDFIPKTHYEIGEALGMMDFQNATKL